MKKLITLFLVLVICISGLTIYYTHKNTPGASKEVSIKIDPRIELMYAVMCTTSWAEDGFTELDFEYKDELCNYFSEYKDHEAVKMADRLIEEIGWLKCLAMPGFMLSHTEPPDFKLLENASPSRMQGDWAKFTELLQDYIRDTDFMEFYEQHGDFYRAVERKSKALLTEENYPAILENYYGMEKKSYTIILAPLKGSHPVCISAEPPIVILTPSKVENNIPIFEDKNYMRLRMFSHAFVHPLVYEYIDEVNKYEKLHKPGMPFYGVDWHRYVNAQIIEGVIGRYILHDKGEGEAMRYIEKAESRGFIYTESFYSKLAEYEDNRDEYHTFEDFFPEILDLLSTLDAS